MKSRKTLSLLGTAMLLAGCAAPEAVSPSGDIRTASAFSQWRSQHEAEVRAYEAFLQSESLQGLVPMHELLRSASDWQKCEAQPFAVPPETQWKDVASVLHLVKALEAGGMLGAFEMHSGYRNAELNQCAGGASRSAHLRGFAMDITPQDAGALPRLCAFWREQGPSWNMGLGQYPSGRIHLDTLGHRTWGRDGSSKTSPCLE